MQAGRVLLKDPRDALLERLQTENAVLREENKVLRAENVALHAENVALRAENVALHARVNQLFGEVTVLRAELTALRGRNSTNSHQPPSKDPPGRKRRAQREKSKRRRGGQPGHPGQHRSLLPPEQVDEIHDLRPGTCEHCDHRLHGEDPAPERHQVFELPKVRPTVTEYRLHALDCPGCGRTTRAPLPEGVPSGIFGPRIVAMVAMATGVLHLSKRQVSGLLLDWFAITASPASVCAMEQLASQAVAPAVEEAREYVRQQPVAHVDETGWREGRRDVWLWIAVTALVTVFLIAARRTRKVAQAILGEHFQGTVVTDRHMLYRWLPLERHQVCWAHLLRDFQEIKEGPPEAAPIGAALVGLGQQVLHHWHRYKDGAIGSATFLKHEDSLRKAIGAVLKRGALCGHAPTAGTCRDLLQNEDSLWVFVRTPGVEPTNNTGERGVRPAVQWRNICFGTDSPLGSRFVERLLTVHATLKQQQCNVLDYLTDACRCWMAGRGPPSLLPTTS